MRLIRSLVPVVVAAAGMAAPLAVAPAAHSAAPTCGGLKATIVGNDKANNITGTAKRDVIVARGGNDTIRGVGGNDVICGGEGADTIQGGDGDDRLYGEADLLRIDQFGRVVKKGDTITGGAGNDTIDLGYDPRAASEGTNVLLDGVAYANAPAAVVVDFRSSRTVPIAAEGSDTVTGYDRRHPHLRLPARRHDQGHQLRRHHLRPRRRRRGLRQGRRRHDRRRHLRCHRQRPPLRRGG